MPALQDLADEIFLEIFSHLVCADIARVCLVSHHFRALGEISLYRTPTFTTTYQPQLPHERFIHTLLTRPELARHVRHLVLESRDIHDWLPDSIIDMSLFPSAAERLGLPHTIQIPTSPITLLLNLLPNLHGLDLLHDGNDRCELDNFIGKHVNGNEPHNLPVWLRQLRHIRDSWVEALIGIDWNTLLALFFLPSIQSIDIHIEYGFEPLIHTGPLSSVTELTLRAGRISTSSLGIILSVPCALKHFALVDFEILDSVFNAQALGAALRPLRGTLRYLRVGLCDYWNMGPEVLGDGTANTIGGFSDWPALKSLRCSLTLLVGRGMEGAISGLAGVLPIGIREVAIEADQCWSGKETADVIEELMGQKDMCGLESLAVITVGIKVRGNVERVRVACQDVGVSLKLSSTWC